MDPWSTHTCIAEGGKRASLIALIMTTVGSLVPAEELLGFYAATVSLLSMKSFAYVHETYLYTACTDGQIRLVGGNSMYEGTVEMCFGNLWGLIAESGWGVKDAEVTCRQLGFPMKRNAFLTNYIGLIRFRFLMVLLT